jgi:hypothetical protein
MQKERFAIGVLGITATILLVGVVLLATSRPAGGTDMNDSGGDYAMATVQGTSSTDYILVTDAATRRMILYEYALNRGRLEPIAAQDLAQLMPPEDRSRDRGRR